MRVPGQVRAVPVEREQRMTAPTFAVGDRVSVRNCSGTWRIVELRLVADEVIVQQGRRRRTVTAADVLLPVRAESERHGR